MNEFQTYEIITHQKNEGQFVAKRICFIFLYIAFVVAWLVFGLKTRILVPLMALIPLTSWALVFLTWRFVNIDYECSMTAGVITFSKIYGGRSRKTVFETTIKSMQLIAPYNDKYRAQIERYSPKTEYSALSSTKASNAYFALFENEKEEKCIFLFEADDKCLRIFRFYNPAGVVIEKR